MRHNGVAPTPFARDKIEANRKMTVFKFRWNTIGFLFFYLDRSDLKGWRVVQRFIFLKTKLWRFHLTPTTISAHWIFFKDDQSFKYAFSGPIVSRGTVLLNRRSRVLYLYRLRWLLLERVVKETDETGKIKYGMFFDFLLRNEFWSFAQFDSPRLNENTYLQSISSRDDKTILRVRAESVVSYTVSLYLKSYPKCRIFRHEIIIIIINLVSGYVFVFTA